MLFPRVSRYSNPAQRSAIMAILRGSGKLYDKLKGKYGGWAKVVAKEFGEEKSWREAYGKSPQLAATGRARLKDLADYANKRLHINIERAQRNFIVKHPKKPGLQQIASLPAKAMKSASSMITNVTKKGIDKVYENPTSRYAHGAYEWMEEGMGKGGEQFMRNLRRLSIAAAKKTAPKVGVKGAAARQFLENVTRSEGLAPTRYTTAGRAVYNELLAGKLNITPARLDSVREGIERAIATGKLSKAKYHKELAKRLKLPVDARGISEELKVAQGYAEKHLAGTLVDARGRIASGKYAGELAYESKGLRPQKPQGTLARLKGAVSRSYISSTARARQTLGRASGEKIPETSAAADAAIIQSHARLKEIREQVGKLQVAKDLKVAMKKKRDELWDKTGKTLADKVTETANAIKTAGNNTAAIFKAEKAHTEAKIEYAKHLETVKNEMKTLAKEYGGKLTPAEREPLEQARVSYANIVATKRHGSPVHLAPAVISGGVGIGILAGSGKEALRKFREGVEASKYAAAERERLQERMKMYKRNHPNWSDDEIRSYALEDVRKERAFLRAKELERERLHTYEQLYEKGGFANALAAPGQPQLVIARKGKTGKLLNQKYNRSISKSVKRKAASSRKS